MILNVSCKILDKIIKYFFNIITTVEILLKKEGTRKVKIIGSYSYETGLK